MPDIIFSKVFGPTDSVADTLTALSPTAGYQFPAGVSLTIQKIRVSYGNVANAKECAGFITITIDGVSGSPFAYAFGNGSGGSTNNGQNSEAETIETSISVPANSLVIVKVLQAEISKDVTVSLLCGPGGNNSIWTMASGGAGQDTTADTALTLTDNAKLLGAKMTPYKSGFIRQIRFAGSGIVDAKAASAKLILEISGYPFPLEFAVGKGCGGATLGGAGNTDVIDDLAIPVSQNGTVVAKVTSAEILLSATLSMQLS